jgi:hypothetical protein
MIFDCEELGELARIEFPRLVPNGSHDFDDRVDSEHVAKYLYSNGDKRTTQFVHSNIRMKIKELATKLKNQLVIGSIVVSLSLKK